MGIKSALHAQRVKPNISTLGIKGFNYALYVLTYSSSGKTIIPTGEMERKDVDMREDMCAYVCG